MATTEVKETVNASAQSVWEILGNFAGVQVGGPVTSVEVEGEGVGAVRTIGMGGAKVIERLEAFDAENMSLKYAIINDDCPLPVSNYSATIDVIANGESACTVEWVGTYEPKGVPEDQASAIIGGIYAGGIAGARKATGG